MTVVVGGMGRLIVLCGEHPNSPLLPSVLLRWFLSRKQYSHELQLRGRILPRRSIKPIVATNPAPACSDATADLPKMDRSLILGPAGRPGPLPLPRANLPAMSRPCVLRAFSPPFMQRFGVPPPEDRRIVLTAMTLIGLVGASSGQTALLPYQQRYGCARDRGAGWVIERLRGYGDRWLAL